ncbi:MAG: hypothetical protein ABIG42_08310, partial [bacterium]
AVFTSLMSTRINFTYSNYNFTTSSVDYCAITTGVESDLKEMFSYRFDLGAHYTISRFQVSKPEFIPSQGYYGIVTKEEENDGWGGIGNIELIYKGEFTGCRVSASHDMKPASGRGGTANRTSFALNFNRRLTEEFSCGINGKYYLNKADEDNYTGITIDEETIRAAVKIRYQFTRLISLDTGFSFTRIIDNEVDTETDRNLIFITYVHKFEFNR